MRTGFPYHGHVFFHVRNQQIISKLLSISLFHFTEKW
jgi:hypothetical protein